MGMGGGTRCERVASRRRERDGRRPTALRHEGRAARDLADLQRAARWVAHHLVRHHRMAQHLRRGRCGGHRRLLLKRNRRGMVQLRGGRVEVVAETEATRGCAWPGIALVRHLHRRSGRSGGP